MSSRPRVVRHECRNDVSLVVTKQGPRRDGGRDPLAAGSVGAGHADRPAAAAHGGGRPGAAVRARLKLDASKAHAYLGWRPKLDLETTLGWIVDWYRSYQAGEDVREVSLADIRRFMAIESKI